MKLHLVILSLLFLLPNLPPLYAQKVVSATEQLKAIHSGNRQKKLDSYAKTSAARNTQQNYLLFKNDAKFAEVATYEAGGKTGLSIKARLAEDGTMPYIYVQNNMEPYLCGFVFPALQSTKDTLLAMYDKYVEWKKVAEENNVTSKEIQLPMSIKGCQLYKIDPINSVVHRPCRDLSPYMIVYKGVPVLQFRETRNMGGKIISDFTAFYLLFRTPDEFKNLIDLLDFEAFYKQLSSNSDDSLFK